jgi:hypothetical protein
MGSGVTFVSATKIDTPDWVGVKAAYAFKDIRMLSLGLLNPPAGLAFSEKSDNLVSFNFTRLPNGHSLLTIEHGSGEPSDAGTPAPPAGTKPTRNEEHEKYVLAMLAGSKIDFAIQVGHLVKTNIPYVDDGKVTVLGADFDEQLADPASIEKRWSIYSPPGGIAAVRGAKGIKLNLGRQLTIEFRK